LFRIPKVNKTGPDHLSGLKLQLSIKEPVLNSDEPYISLKNPENHTNKQAVRLEDLKLKDLNLKTMRAYQLRLNFQELWAQPSDQAERFLNKWYYWATHSRLGPIKEAA
jgi:transposase